MAIVKGNVASILSGDVRAESGYFGKRIRNVGNSLRIFMHFFYSYVYT